MEEDVQVELFQAIENNNYSEFLACVDDNANLNQRDLNGQTPLILASEKGHLDIVKELLTHNVEANTRDEDGWTALIAASKQGYHDIVLLLLDYGAKFNIPDIGGWTPLVWASYKGHLDIVSELLVYGANVNEVGQHNMTALIWASGRGHTEVVQELIQHGAKVEVADKYGTSALIWACRKGHYDVAKLLLAEGANCNTAGTHGWTPLIMASKGGYLDVATLLLEEKPNVNAVDQDGRSALSWAAKEGYEDIVTKLLERGAFINMPDKAGDTPLMLSSKEGHLGVVTQLITSYAELERMDNERKTALYHAIERGNLEVVTELLNNGANIEHLNKDGDTPLLKASKKGDSQCVQLLINKGVNVTAVDKKGDSALHIAVRNKQGVMCDALLESQHTTKLLHQANRANETPYSIDATNQPSLLQNSMQRGKGGRYDFTEMDLSKQHNVLLTTMADFLVEPSLTIPLSVGVFSKWGKGKSVYVQRLMTLLSELRYHETIPAFLVTMPVVFIIMIMSVTIGLLMWLAATWEDAIATAVCVKVLSLAILAIARLSLVSTTKLFHSFGYLVTRFLNRCMWLTKIVYCLPPSTAQVRNMLPVHLVTVDLTHKVLIDDSPLTSLVNFTSALTDAIEEDLGIIIPRLYRIFQANYRTSGQQQDVVAQWRTSCCCIPSFIITLAILLCLWLSIILFKQYGLQGSSEVAAIQIACVCVLCIAGAVIFLRLFLIIYCLVLSMKKRVRIVSSQAGIQEETFVSVLKQEIDLCVDMLDTIDGFAQQQTRVVINMDFLESLEQGKVLHLINLCNLLLSEAGHPFIVLLSVDPRLLVKAVDQTLTNIQGGALDTPHNYLKNLIDLPFYMTDPICVKIDGIVPIEFRTQLAESSGDNPDELEWDGDADFHLSNEIINNGPPMLGNGLLPSQRSEYQLVDRQESVENVETIADDLSQLFHNNENRTLADIKRIMNIVSFNGRVLRCTSVQFQWTRLAIWVAICDEWPYKSSWITLLCLDSSLDLPEKMQVRRVNDVFGYAMPIVTETDLGVDRENSYFDTFLSSHKPILTVADVRNLSAFMFYMDPNIRRSMMDYLIALKSGPSSKPSSSRRDAYPVSPTSSKFTWHSTQTDQHFMRMTVDDVANQLDRIDGIDQSLLPDYKARLHENNINGRVIASSELNELRDVMRMKFGDWTLFKAWVIPFIRKDTDVTRFVEKISNYNSATNSCLDDSQSSSILGESPKQSMTKKHIIYPGAESSLPRDVKDHPYISPHETPQDTPQATPQTHKKYTKRKKIIKATSMSQEPPEIVARGVEDGWHRSADSGFASTDVDPSIRNIQNMHRQNSLPERHKQIVEEASNMSFDEYPLDYPAPSIRVQQASKPPSPDKYEPGSILNDTWHSKHDIAVKNDYCNGEKTLESPHKTQQVNGHTNRFSLSEVPLPPPFMLDDLPLDPPLEFTDQPSVNTCNGTTMTSNNNERKMAFKNASKSRSTFTTTTTSTDTERNGSIDEKSRLINDVIETTVSVIRGKVTCEKKKKAVLKQQGSESSLNAESCL